MDKENEKALPGRAELLDRIAFFGRIKEVRDCDDIEEIKALLRTSKWVAFDVTREGTVRMGRLWAEAPNPTELMSLVLQAGKTL